MLDWLSHSMQRALPLMLVLSAISAPANGSQNGVGLTRFEFRTASVDTPIVGYIFYPSAVGPKRTQIGVYEVAAHLDAPPLSGGRSPLVIISHGQGGSPLGHHDLATFLSAHGYVVASLEHPKDNVNDSSGVGTAEVLLGRPMHVSALIDALDTDRSWSSLIDFERIGVTGFSMGGYTSLVLVGARPNFERLLDLCNANVEPAVCDLLAQKGASLDPDRPAEAYVASLTAAASGHSLSDTRIRAAFVMAPMALVFDAKSMHDVKLPVYVHYATADRVLEPALNAANLIEWIPNLAGQTAVADADHWVYLAPCSNILAQAVPEICTDPPEVDRAALHRQIAQQALAFFSAHLASE